MQHSCSHYNAICNHPSSRSSLNRTPPFKVKSQSDLQAPFIKVMWSLTPPFKVNSQSRTTLQGQVSIAHHPSRSSLNRAAPFKVKSQSDLQRPFIKVMWSLTPPFKVNSQSRTTLQGQVSIAHHPSRSSLNRAPPFKVKSQSHTTLHTTLQGQVSIAHHPFSIAHHPSRSSLNRTPPFKVKCQSRTTLHHFKTQNSICPYLGSIASQLPLTTWPYQWILIWLLALTILKNMSSSMGRIIPHIMEIYFKKNPNHQPDINGIFMTFGFVWWHSDTIRIPFWYHSGHVWHRRDGPMDWFCWENLHRKPSIFPLFIWGFSVKFFPTKPIHRFIKLMGISSISTIYQSDKPENITTIKVKCSKSSPWPHDFNRNESGEIDSAATCSQPWRFLQGFPSDVVTVI